ncbi:MAG TPA: alpha/beta fold hydrolase [Stellaceae bacterium]|nr:alpha/beta fold hydrolase [Stellaceae bacterium]
MADPARGSKARSSLCQTPPGPQPSFFELPSALEARIEAQASFIWSQACTGKFVWPIPDKAQETHPPHSRADANYLGTADTLIAPAYAQQFADRITNARVELVQHAGHLPHLEQPDEVSRLVSGFLRE